MILSFHGHDRNRFIKEANEMFQLRARTFKDRLGWDVEVRDGWEKDEFDDLNPLYLVSLRDGHVSGCLRLLPTTGPTLLAGPLSRMFDHAVEIRSPLILEGTRFAVEDHGPPTAGGVSCATAELLMAACEVMLENGYSHMVGAIELRTLRVCRRTGWSPSVIARSSRPTGIVAVLWEVSTAALDHMKQRHGFAPRFVNGDEADRLAV
jgi:N-acyl-L-homoserine lactone synthetase